MTTSQAVYHLQPADPYKAGAWTYVPERAHQSFSGFSAQRHNRVPESASPRHRS
ncbi:hypothetical protein [Corynebacterium gerontici]|uniref:Uncharacterized protein n=1 Tax=Corynebacterium gerontici TaxID=2079234 RepID=A0A3G6IZH5_9CORY|nr:hypothetical protein CGERO_03900 [Corynebacterium gerontici]